ncbi:GNAT family N-acetyltransferase [Corynebacterium sp.]|uniref:GNAT family N-acetyltransferase n=1 Tax=Corynebacterium sp. TaxID=1720 RepID=UPI0026DA7729|nr:GNAT family N-acetyltransferase [Corynebacterium sp.]MDO5031378.1 GNAT family N-acetyltransferase [Corynebacterium sp.]
MTYSIRRLSPQEFAIAAPALVDIYIAAMSYSPSIRATTISRWKEDIMRPGFAAVAAVDEYGVAGFAYGFLGSPDTWWDRQLRRGLAERGGANPAQEEMLRSYFELAEIHVIPHAQGHGLGTALLTQLAWNLPAQHMLLSTPEVPREANAAFSLYRRMGFEDFLRHLMYPADSRAFAILSATLPLNTHPEPLS